MNHLGPLLLPVVLLCETATAGLGMELEFYGEILYSHFDYRPASYGRPAGSKSDSRAIMDIPRLVTEIEMAISNDFYFEVEVEFEHGGTGAALEVENEEFGEYETEVEKGGEVVLEQFFVVNRFSPWLGVKLGHFILPVGLLNQEHLPTHYLPTTRPEAETALIPVTWHETGIALFGQFMGLVEYSAMVVNGLDATGFDSRNWVRDGRQTRFEQLRATDLAFAGAVAFVGVWGLRIGASGYTGNSTGNRPKSDLKDVNGRVAIGELHGRYRGKRLFTRASLMYGRLRNSGLISAKNRSLSTNLGVARTPVAESAMAAGAEAGFDILSLFPNIDHRLLPFARYEYYNSMHTVTAGMSANPVCEKTVIRGGMAYLPTESVVIKCDYGHRTFGTSAVNPENTFSLALGFNHSVDIWK